MLLTREEFERRVFERDGNKCVICGAPPADAHHLIERSLWTGAEEKQGYLLDNGVSVCPKHHIAAEKDFIPPQAFRRVVGLPTITPKGFDAGKDYSKWGAPFRMPMRDLAKYPSTSYMDISPGHHGGNDVIDSTAFFDVPVVVTIKMDGSNVVLRRDSVGARNGDTANHRSFDMLKSVHARIRQLIPAGLEVFAEWLYAKHSIHYTGALALESYMHVIAVYDTAWRLWLSWDETVDIARRIGYPTVPVLCTGVYAGWQVLERLTTLGTDVIKTGHEGIVIRNSYPFHYGQFGRFVGKYVRENHVQTDAHWQTRPLIKNDVR